VDGGMIYADRRQAQSASDASSLAGGGNIALWLDNNHINFKNFSCSDPRLPDIMNYGIYKAQERAEDNDFIDEEISVTAACEDNGPKFDRKYVDIATHITTETETSLVQVVYGGPTVNQVNSVVRVRPKSPLAFGHAIVALNDDPVCGTKNGMHLGGSNVTFVNGGGLWSNGCLKCEGLQDFQVVVINGSIVHVGPKVGCDPLDLIPPPIQETDPLPYSSYSVPVPNCNHPNAITVDSIGNNTTLQSGKLYCITNSNNAVKVTSGFLYGNDVTLYMVNGGDVEINNNITQLYAPPTDWVPEAPVPGLLIYVNPVRTSEVVINGNVDSAYVGLIYAPAAEVTINGTGDVTTPNYFSTQIIGYDVKITGNAVIDVRFEEGSIYPKPPYLDLID
jgi:hypothetical protein